MGRKDSFEPYRDAIQGLLLGGMSIAKAYEYMEEHYNLNKTYQSFYMYVRRKEIKYVTKQKNVKTTHIDDKTIPEFCRFPNCFECIYRDCMRDGSASVSGEELYDLYRKII